MMRTSEVYGVVRSTFSLFNSFPNALTSYVFEEQKTVLNVAFISAKQQTLPMVSTFYVLSAILLFKILAVARFPWSLPLFRKTVASKIL